MSQRINESTSHWTNDQRISGSANRRVNQWMNGWMDEWIGWLVSYFFVKLLFHWITTSLKHFFPQLLLLSASYLCGFFFSGPFLLLLPPSSLFCCYNVQQRFCMAKEEHYGQKPRSYPGLATPGDKTSSRASQIFIAVWADGSRSSAVHHWTSSHGKGH